MFAIKKNYFDEKRNVFLIYLLRKAEKYINANNTALHMCFKYARKLFCLLHTRLNVGNLASENTYVNEKFALVAAVCIAESQIHMN